MACSLVFFFVFFHILKAAKRNWPIILFITNKDWRHKKIKHPRIRNKYKKINNFNIIRVANKSGPCRETEFLI